MGGSRWWNLDNHAISSCQVTFAVMRLRSRGWDLDICHQVIEHLLN